MSKIFSIIDYRTFCIGVFQSKLISGCRKRLYCPWKTIFWCLGPFLAKIFASIFEIMRHIWKSIPRGWPSKLDYKTFCIGVFQSKFISGSRKWLYCPWKTIFMCLTNFFCKNPCINFWNNGTYEPKHVKIMPKIDARIFAKKGLRNKNIVFHGR